MSAESVNQCELNCPRKALGGVILREDIARSGFFGKMLATAEASVTGLELMGRAALVCPNRGLPAGSWTPDERCAEIAADTIRERPVEWSRLTDYEQRVLGPYLQG